MISAKVIADSISPAGKRITTLALEYPRFIHAEFMTHRMFSRNAASSRAIPVEKMIQRVIENPAIPIHWGKNQRGMHALEEIGAHPRWLAECKWLDARDDAIKHAKRLLVLDLHKQVVNRILEPFMHITVLVTATEWGNFFNLRLHKDAQPEIQMLAAQMWSVMEDSIPVTTWKHLPFLTPAEIENLWTPNDPQYAASVSAARCARVSYLNIDDTTPSVEKDLELYERLMGGTPKHASPTEHQAFAFTDGNRWSNNFKGWRQFREMIPGNYLPRYPHDQEGEA